MSKCDGMVADDLAKEVRDFTKQIIVDLGLKAPLDLTPPPPSKKCPVMSPTDAEGVGGNAGEAGMTRRGCMTWDGMFGFESHAYLQSFMVPQEVAVYMAGFEALTKTGMLFLPRSLLEPAILRLIEMAIEARLHEIGFLRPAARKSWSTLSLKVIGKDAAPTAVLTNDFELPMVGPVSTARSIKQCVITTVINSQSACGNLPVPFFIRGDRVSGLGDACPVPAWHIPIVPDGEASLRAQAFVETVQLPQDIVKVIKSNAGNWEDDSVQKITDWSVAITYFKLLPNVPPGGFSVEPVLLTREALTNEVFKKPRAGGQIAASVLPFNLSKLLGPSAAVEAETKRAILSGDVSVSASKTQLGSEEALQAKARKHSLK